MKSNSVTTFFFIIDLNDNYNIVLRYANQGNLREHLKINFHTLKWKDKIQMALNITCGLKYLHSKQIIHRDLVMIFFILYLL